MAISMMDREVKQLALSAKGFLTEAEGMRLFELAREYSQYAPCLEIGSYCGKSTIFLAEGCRVTGKNRLITIDHHRGSEEQQPNEEYFDPDLIDPSSGQVDTLPNFRSNIYQAGLEDWVMPIIARSQEFGRYWQSQPLSLLFIDGGHSESDAFGDFHTWSPHIMIGGYLCIHDIFPDPADGGQAPYHVFEHACSTGEWEFVDQVETLGTLRRLKNEQIENKNRRNPLLTLFGKFSQNKE